MRDSQLDLCVSPLTGRSIDGRHRVRRLRNVRAAYALLTTLFASLGFAASAPSAAPAASAIAGDWKGTIDTGRGSLRVVFHLTQDKEGKLTGTMDSPDQNAAGIVVSSVSYEPPEVRLTIEQFQISYGGKLDKDKIVGTWKQGTISLPLILER